jgi:hypothetical protein
MDRQFYIVRLSAPRRKTESRTLLELTRRALEDSKARDLTIRYFGRTGKVESWMRSIEDYVTVERKSIELASKVGCSATRPSRY